MLTASCMFSAKELVSEKLKRAGKPHTEEAGPVKSKGREGKGHDMRDSSSYSAPSPPADRYH